MRLLVISDIHGSHYYAKEIKNIFEREKADVLILLGDLYYHGPRNPLPKDYNPIEVSKELNSLKEYIKAVKGNCDAEVDEMISEFEMVPNLIIENGGKKIYFTHGHKKNIDELPNEDFDVMIYGHYHTGFIKEKDGKIFANPGSLSLPKGGTMNSYLIVDDKGIVLKSFENGVIEVLSF